MFLLYVCKMASWWTLHGTRTLDSMDCWIQQQLSYLLFKQRRRAHIWANNSLTTHDIQTVSRHVPIFIKGFLIQLHAIIIMTTPRYENTEAVGELCHCMGEKCNSAEKLGSRLLAAVLTVVFAFVLWDVVLYTEIKIRWRMMPKDDFLKSIT